jgi:hypothetical protein
MDRFKPHGGPKNPTSMHVRAGGLQELDEVSHGCNANFNEKDGNIFN